MGTKYLSIALTALALACDAPPDSTSGPITITQDLHYVTGDSVLSEPGDIDFTIAAYQFADNGEFIEYAGGLTASDTFEISDAPDGRYYLKFGSAYHVTSRRYFALNRATLGRKDAVRRTQPTDFDIDINGTVPWAADDELQVFSTGSGTGIWLDKKAWPGLATTSTRDLFWGSGWGSRRYLNNATRGDRLDVIHLQSGHNGWGKTLVAREILKAAVTEQDSVTTVVTGQFSELPMQTISFDLRASEFNQWAPQVGTPGGVETQRVSVIASALPHNRDYGIFGACGDIFQFTPDFPDEDARLSLSYGNPYPDDWVFVIASQYFYVTMPGNENSLSLTSVRTFVSLTDLSTTTIRPVVSPVNNALIDGRDLLARQDLVTETPTLSWEAPDVGSPVSYSVAILHLVASPEAPAFSYEQQVGSVQTAQTSVKIPHGLLVPGDEYYFRITAIAPGGDASMLTNFVTP